MSSTTLLLLLSLAAVPTGGQAQDDHSFLFSGDGVGEGQGRFGVGLTGVLVGSDSGVGGIPALGLYYARGLSGPLDLRLSLQSLGLYNGFDAGFGFALVRHEDFGFGVRAGITGMVVINPSSDQVAGIFAGTPGLVATLRRGGVAFSIGADVPLYFNGFLTSPSASNAAFGFVPALRPNLSIELGGSSAMFFMRGEATIFMPAGVSGTTLAHVSLGVHF